MKIGASDENRKGKEFLVNHLQKSGKSLSLTHHVEANHFGLDAVEVGRPLNGTAGVLPRVTPAQVENRQSIRHDSVL